MDTTTFYSEFIPAHHRKPHFTISTLLVCIT